MIIDITVFKPNLIIYEVRFNNLKRKTRLVMIEAKTHSCFLPSVQIIKTVWEFKDVSIRDLEYFDERDITLKRLENASRYFDKFLIIKEGEVTKL